MPTHFDLSPSHPLHAAIYIYFIHFSMDFIFNVSLIYLFQLWRLLLLWFFGLYIWSFYFLFIQRRFTLIMFGVFIVHLLRECECVRFVPSIKMPLPIVWPTNCNASVFGWNFNDCWKCHCLRIFRLSWCEAQCGVYGHAGRVWIHTQCDRLSRQLI